MIKKIILFSSFLVMSSTPYAGLYRWVDETGKVHYSDKIPASVSKKSHSELAENGILKKKVDPKAEIQRANIKSEEENLLQKKKELEEKLKLEAQEKMAEKHKRDKVLLLTYEDKDELVHYFEDKIKRLDGNSRILKAQSKVLQENVSKLEKRKSVVKNEVFAKSLDKKIIKIKNNIQQYEKALKENTQEIVIINTTFQNDYKRFTELTK